MAHHPSLSNSLSKMRARVRARGLREVLGETTSRIRNTLRSDEELIFLTRAALWEGRIDRKSDEPLQLVKATPSDGRDYERFIGTDSARTFAKRLSHGTSCWFVRGRGIVLHATWTTTSAAWTREIERYFVPTQDGAYIYESFTRPEARGLGVYPFALVEIGRALAGEGIGTLFVGVEGGNAASVRAITKAGFEPAFTVSFHRRFGRFRLDDSTGPRPDLAARCLLTPEVISRRP